MDAGNRLRPGADQGSSSRWRTFELGPLIFDRECHTIWSSLAYKNASTIYTQSLVQFALEGTGLML